MTTKNYPKACVFRLDERDGRLWYGEHAVGPVPTWFWPGSKAAPVFGWQGEEKGRWPLLDALGDGWLLEAVYRCRVCDHWAVGSGHVWCSDDCRRADMAEQARKRRAEQQKAPLVVACAICGGPIEEAKRGTRKFCSARCRQVAHRQKRHQEMAA